MKLLEDLVRELEAANVGSRDLDADIYEAIGYATKRRPELLADSTRRFSVCWRYLDDGRWLSMGHLTTSLDDALRAVHRHFPDIYWLIGRGKLTSQEPPFGVQLMFGADEVVGLAESSGGPALAVMAALLRAIRYFDVQRLVAAA